MANDDQTNSISQDNGDMDLPAEMFRSVENPKDITFQMYKDNAAALSNVDGKYSEVDDIGLFEGDIALATLQEIEDAKKAAVAKGIGIKGDQFRWKGINAGILTIPYVNETELEQVVKAAIAHWESKTPIRFKKRTVEDDYLSFEKKNGCWSFVGRRGGKQTISLGSGCGLGSAIHEIGHSLGLWHEQSRSDRDNYIEVIQQNIISSQKHNFDKHILDGTDLGPYNFGSIMHYPATAFSKNGLETIKTKGGQSIGQRSGLSAGDIAAIRILYPDLAWNNKGASAADAGSNEN